MKKNLWWVAFFLSIALLMVHSFGWSKIRVDYISIILLLLILISPSINALRKIKYGGFEAEIGPKEIEEAKTNVEKSLLSKNSKKKPQPEIRLGIGAILDLVTFDPIIALAKIRIELEKTLNRLAIASEIQVETSLSRLIQTLSSHGIILPNISKSLIEVMHICNRAIHGETISEQSAKTMVNLGVALLKEIYWIFQNQISSTIVKEEVILKKELDGCNTKKYQLTSVIPLVKNPKKIVRELTQEQLNEFLEDYSDYTEFIVELIEISPNTKKLLI